MRRFGPAAADVKSEAEASGFGTGSLAPRQLRSSNPHVWERLELARPLSHPCFAEVYQTKVVAGANARMYVKISRIDRCFELVEGRRNARETVRTSFQRTCESIYR